MSGAGIRTGIGGSPRDRIARRVLPLVAGHLRPATPYGARMVSGIGLRYPAPRRAHPLTGRRFPDLRLKGVRRLYEALRGGRFLLVAPEEVTRRAAFRACLELPRGPVASGTHARRVAEMPS